MAAGGLDAAAGIAGIIALSITLFNGCVKAISIISAAKAAEHDVERFRLMLEWEQYRILRWGEKAGLCAQLREDLKLNWTLVKELLQQLHGDLTNAQALHAKYGLRTVDDDQSDPAQGSIDDATSASSKSSRLAGRVWVSAGKNLVDARERILQQPLSIIRKLKWTELDSNKGKKLLQDIRSINDALQDLLDDASQTQLKDSLSAIMRQLLSLSKNVADVETLTAFLDERALNGNAQIEEASQMKRIRLCTDVDRRASEIKYKPSKRPQLRRIRFDKLSKFRSCLERESWEIAEFRVPSNSTPVHALVLLEWKKISRATEQRVQRRMQELTLLLTTYTETNLHALKCLGYSEKLTQDQTTTYAYVFELLNLLEARNGQMVDRQPLSLTTFMKRPGFPSLTQRLRMCQSLAESVLQMHTAGWLHKGICSTHVLFTEAVDSSGVLQPIEGPFIAGFEFTRHNIEDTETMPFSQDRRLFQHSQVRLPDPTKPFSFRKEYDLHALGCVFVEIIFWQQLEDVLLSSFQSDSGYKGSTKDDSINLSNLSLHEKETNLMKYKRQLETGDGVERLFQRAAFAAGEQFELVIRLCLCPQTVATWSRENAEPDEDEPDDTVDLQVEIVQMLRRLVQHV